MSHIDAKAETKGVRKAYTKNGYFICRCGVVAMPLTDDSICDCGDLYEQEWNFVEVRAAPLPQRHARINCNGKSCGEFNCDTCHPREGELPTTDEYLERAAKFMESAKRMNGAPVVYMVAAAFKNEDRANRAEAELAALKATPKEVRDETFNDWYMDNYQNTKLQIEKDPRNSEWKPIYLWGEAAWNAAMAQSSPSLPLEEPEQMALLEVDTAISDCFKAASFGTNNGSPWLGISRESLVSLRALAARRGGE